MYILNHGDFYIMKHILATDVDSVLLSYMCGLIPFMNEKGLDVSHMHQYKGSSYYPTLQELFKTDEQTGIKLMLEFNASHHIKNMPIFEEGAEKALADIHNQGIHVVAVTCIGSDYMQKLYRFHNLASVFGEVFSHVDQVINVPVRTSKEPYLQQLMQSGNVLGFVDDRLNHLKEAKNVGIQPIWFNNLPNLEVPTDIIHINSLNKLPELVSQLVQSHTQQKTRKISI